MSLEWIREEPARWDADKQRIIGEAAAGIYDRRFAECKAGDIMPGAWWRAEKDGRPVGYGWLDLVWGDAEITIATDPDHHGEGVGSFILAQLENEARERGVNYIYNTVRPTHPEKERVTAWFEKRGFEPSDDGSLLRAATHSKV